MSAFANVCKENEKGKIGNFITRGSESVFRSGTYITFVAQNGLERKCPN